MAVNEPGRFRCPSCQRSHRWKPELAGKKVRCPCGAVVVTPQAPPPGIDSPPRAEPCIVNIVNFIRAVEPRLRMNLVEPVERQIELLTRHDLPATWLIQYDALVQGPYAAMLKALPPAHEVGAWFEVVQPLVEKAGLPWRGLYPWDWRAHVGFSIGYAPAEREKLADVFMEDFKAAFGRYPATVGSWVLDAHRLGYLHERYAITAACNCKDQWGTDGYTLWGGYWSGAYYPSRRNAFMPAQEASEQVPVPVFRMLGSDPIYQYDAGAAGGAGLAADLTAGLEQSVVTLEPVCAQGGGNPAWVRWFFDVLEHSPRLSFAYAQAGQENSFGWVGMAPGLSDQLALLAEKARMGGWRVETLGASARWFRETFPLTPESALVALRDWRGQGRRSAWYQSRFYRVNLLWEDSTLRIRDLHKFDQAYAERYLSEPCTTAACRYDTLPVVEGLLWSRADARAALVPMARTAGAAYRLHGGDPVVAESGTGGLLIRWPVDVDGDFVVVSHEDAIEFASDLPEWWLELKWAPGVPVPFVGAGAADVKCRHEGFDYGFHCRPGRVALDLVAGRLRLLPEGGKIVVRLGKVDGWVVEC